MGQSVQTVHMLTKRQVFYDNNLKQALGFQNHFYLKKAQQIRPMLYDGNVIAKETNVISIADSEESLMLEDESRSKMLLKQSDSMVLEKKISNPSTDSSDASPVKWMFLVNYLSESVKKDIDEIKTINIELEHRVSKLIAENEHLKQTYKQLYDSNKPTRIHAKEHSEALIDQLNKRKLRGKGVVNCAAQIPIATTIVPGMFKLDLDPLAPRITSTKLVPHTETTPHSAETPKPELKIYSWGPKQVKNVGLSKRAKIVETKVANNLEANHSWGSNATDVPSSSSLVMTGCPDCSLISKIMGYGDYQRGNVTILMVYYVEGLGHNLFSVGQFCDSDLEVAFRKHTCFVRNLEGVDLLLGSQETNLYTLSIGDMIESSPICLLSKASKTKSWLWHKRLSHLNFGAINHLARHGLVRGLPKLKFEKDHLRKLTVFTTDVPEKIIETIHVDFDELTAMASEQSNLEPALHEMILLVFDAFFSPSASVVSLVLEVPALVESTGLPSSTSIDQDAPLPKTVSEESSPSDVIPTTMHSDIPISEHPKKWTKDHLLQNIIGELSRPVSTRLQLHEQALFYYYDAFLTSVEPKTYKDALTHSCWIEAMQEELMNLNVLKSRNLFLLQIK
ncbi:retrovirus-related pol polyprotein from transposon TNT 1-94 [Tanacetum coccineum]|uniref:Retrovirus-related pol polyprotein from transposon TNT 1-94 n=1 Tax=Tanacetum coccineum TaxID=301880 RepID=A0ABQ5HYM7_9ASTR